MKILKELTFIFDNLETMTIRPDDIGIIAIDGMHRAVTRSACNAITEYLATDLVAIELFNSADGQYDGGCTRFTRIDTYADITAIELLYTNGEKRTVYVDYDADDDSIGAPNVNQTSFFSHKHNFYVVISRQQTAYDFFDEETVNAAASRRDMIQSCAYDEELT